MHHANSSYAPYNYQSLTNELETDTALEDLHMFFVAFYQRQKRIIEMLEHKDKNQNTFPDEEAKINAGSASVKDKQELDPSGSKENEAVYPPNVEILETEITLEI